MPGGFTDVVGPALLFLLAVALGVIFGRYLWPRRRDASSVSRAQTFSGRAVSGSRPGPAFPQPGTPAASRVPADDHDFVLDPLSIGAGIDLGGNTPAGQAATANTEALPEQAQAQVIELEKRLKESQWALTETWRQLSQTGAELVRLRVHVRELENRAETEMGRLESGAIAALDSTIAKHREQVVALEEKLRAAENTIAEQARELAVERGRRAQLQSALAERDQQVATLMREQG